MLGVDILSNRTVSTFPLSVATSLAFESIFTGPLPPVDPERVPPVQVDIRNYQEIWLNIATLFRNLLGALSREDARRMTERDVVVVLEQEIDTVISILRNEGNNIVKPVFYVCNYKEVHRPRKYPHARLRGDRTPGQLAYRALCESTIELLLTRHKKYQGEDRSDIRVFDSTLLPKESTKAIVITHVAYDLLSYKKFRQLDLLESHTGVLKSRVLWYTKYFQGKTLPMIPFMEEFLQIFGDTETFSPLDIRLRREIIDIAERHRWTQLTTKEKIVVNLQEINNPFFKAVVNDIF